MAERFVPVKLEGTPYFGVLDCANDILVREVVVNQYGFKNTPPKQFKYLPAATYWASVHNDDPEKYTPASERADD